VVAIARYYFYSVTGAIAPLLNLTNNGSGSDANNKVAVANLWVCHTRKLKFCKNEVDKYMLVHALEHSYFCQKISSYVSEMKRLNTFIISCDAVS